MMMPYVPYYGFGDQIIYHKQNSPCTVVKCVLE